MFCPSLIALAAAALLALPDARTAQLIAIGRLDGSAAGLNGDLSGLTGTLENGTAANLLGGLGSGLKWAVPKTEFLDFRKTLVDAAVGITDALVPAKIEGLAFGADVA